MYCSEIEAASILKTAMDILPRLGRLGLYSPKRPFVMDKKNLLEVAACVDYIRTKRRTKTMRPNAHSYSLKHKVEDSIGFYISNGAFIAAAVGLGLPFKPVNNDVNALFPLSI